MTLTPNEILKEIKEEYVSKSDWSGCYSIDIDEDYERFDLIEQEDWTQEHKFQHRQSVYRDKNHDVYILVNESRSGDHYRGWESYDEPSIEIVEKIEREVVKTVVEWKKISSDESTPVQAVKPFSK